MEKKIKVVLFITRGDTKLESQRKINVFQTKNSSSNWHEKMKSERRIHEEFELREAIGNYNSNPHENGKVNVWVDWGFLEFLKLWS